MTQLRPQSIFLVLIALFMSLLNCCNLYALDVLDQSNVVAPGRTSYAYFNVDERYASGQTVRAGVAGLLSHVELGVFRDYSIASPLFVDIVRTQNDQPSFAAADRLATRTVNQDQIPLLSSEFEPHNSPAYTVSFDFLAAAIPFNAGDSFGIVLRSTAPAMRGYSWWVTSSELVNTYPAGGTFALEYATNTVSAVGQRDTHFATYVAVPEPSTLLLLAIGAISLLGYRKAKS